VAKRVTDMTIYTPAMKTKRGEMRALREMLPTSAASLLPLIDVLAIPDGDNGDRVQRHIERHLQFFVDAWSRRWPFYLDLFDVGAGFRGPNNVHPVRIAFSFLRGNGYEPISVVGLDRDAAYLRAVREEIAEGAEVVCVRLLEEDCLQPDSTLANVRRLFQAMEAAGLDRHAILDFRGIENKRSEVIGEQVQRMCQVLSEEGFSRIVFLASSMPASMGGIARESMTHIERREYLIWRDLIGRLGYLVFGDYGVVHPDYVDLDPRVIHPAAKIRYATTRHWLVAKGRQWIADTSQHRRLAVRVMDEPEYRVGVGGWGEKYLRRCAKGGARTGTLETWVSVDTNIHLEFVLRQVSRVLIGSTREVTR